MTEDQRRHRGYHLLETMCTYIRGEIRWESLTSPQHPTTTRGMFDPAKGWYDQDAGPKDRITGPRITTIDIDALPAGAYPGESITLTPAWLQQNRVELARAGLWPHVREYARGDATYRIASWWNSRKAVRWSNRAPHPLREACLQLADTEPMNPNTVRAYRAPLHLTRGQGETTVQDGLAQPEPVC